MLNEGLDAVTHWKQSSTTTPSAPFSLMTEITEECGRKATGVLDALERFGTYFSLASPTWFSLQPYSYPIKCKLLTWCYKMLKVQLQLHKVVFNGKGLRMHCKLCLSQPIWQMHKSCPGNRDGATIFTTDHNKKAENNRKCMIWPL